MKAVEINYELFGSEFANSDSKNQANFLKGFARELKHWQSDHHKEMQGYDVMANLCDDDIKQLKMFFDIIINTNK